MMSFITVYDSTGRINKIGTLSAYFERIYMPGMISTYEVFEQTQMQHDIKEKTEAAIVLFR